MVDTQENEWLPPADLESRLKAILIRKGEGDVDLLGESEGFLGKMRGPLEE